MMVAVSPTGSLPPRSDAQDYYLDNVMANIP